MQTKKLLALTTILLFSLLVFLPTVYASSEDKILTIYIETSYLGVVDSSYVSYGTVWGDFTGWVIATPVVYKVLDGGNWLIYCHEDWFAKDPTKIWGKGLRKLKGLDLDALRTELDRHATMISEVDGVIETTRVLCYLMVK